VMTTSALSDSAILLVGPLAQHRRGSIPGRPHLELLAHCPVCRCVHAMPWPDVFRLDGAELVDAPCPKGPWKGQRIAVALDPTRMAEHRREAADFAARLRRWRVETRLRRSLAEARALDRKHLADGWDVVIPDGR
jgi:hypothetical protein